jgi:ubiquinone/menaquinone biosynthesis C-methylase UbiE
MSAFASLGLNASTFAMPTSDLTHSSRGYWDHAAETYEQDFAGTVIGGTRRDAVWRELDAAFRPGDRILELNCGTGIDAVHLAERGIQITACDISPRMIELARERALRASLGDRASFRVVPTEDLASIQNEGPFDGAFSSFSGLNCVQNLSGVRENLARLVKPGAKVVVSVMGRFVPWEVLWFLAHGDLKKASRRCHRKDVFDLDAGKLNIRFRSVAEMARQFAPDFRLTQWKGVGIAVPPSYMEHWARRFPRVTRALAQADRLLGRAPLFRGMADCILLKFQRTQGIET